MAGKSAINVLGTIRGAFYVAPFLFVLHINRKHFIKKYNSSLYPAIICQIAKYFFHILSTIYPQSNIKVQEENLPK